MKYCSCHILTKGIVQRDWFRIYNMKKKMNMQCHVDNMMCPNKALCGICLWRAEQTFGSWKINLIFLWCSQCLQEYRLMERCITQISIASIIFHTFHKIWCPCINFCKIYLHGWRFVIVSSSNQELFRGEQ